jgi:hypothetical protein
MFVVPGIEKGTTSHHTVREQLRIALCHTGHLLGPTNRYRYNECTLTLYICVCVCTNSESTLLISF